MKTIQFVILVVAIMFIMHCKDEEVPGEPIPMRHFYVFVDENGNNFFDSNPEYIADSVKMNAGGPNSRVFLSEGFANDSFSTEDYEGYDIFESEAWYFKQYVMFGNGDIDTIHATWKPSDMSPLTEFFYPEFKEFNIYFNGELADHWNFETGEGISQRGLLESYEERTPYITEIRKDADPDEFDK